MTDPVQHATVHTEDVKVRRSVKFGSFLAVGAGIGVVVGVAAAVSQRAAAAYSIQQVIGFMALIGGVLGIAIGALIALAVDRGLSRRARTVSAQRTTVVTEESAD